MHPASGAVPAAETMRAAERDIAASPERFINRELSWLHFNRRVLEEARSLDEAIEIFKTSKRTCEYFFVIGDAKINSAAGIEGGADQFSVVRPGESDPRLPRAVPHAVLLSSGD